jgi:LysW-gamma-L-alpha-aminoadipyl-6-phosphate/LysW-L-glutamyl-5-phosphate reductase
VELVSAGIVGASGMLGGELLRVLSVHPVLRSECIVAGARAGESIVAVHPHLRDVLHGSFERHDASAIAERCRVAFVALPAEEAATTVPALLDAGVEVVFDLSPAYRLKDAELHDRWYPDARRDPDLAAAAVYGLPELNRKAIAEARLVAMPGCSATAALLALGVLTKLDVPLDAVVIDAKSGSSGSGGALRTSALHSLRGGGVAPYAMTSHRHVPEIRQACGEFGLHPAGAEVRLGMSVFSVDLVRGLSAAVYVLSDGAPRSEDVRRGLHRRYRAEPFIRVQPAQGTTTPLPDPKAVIGSNFCDIGGGVDADGGRIVVVAALDNVAKGGATQAVQACNAWLGIAETTGLLSTPIWP